MGLLSSIGSIVGKFASPILGTIGTAIGGPVGGTIGTSIGGLLGSAGGFVDDNFGSIASGVAGYYGAKEQNAANKEIAELTTASNERLAEQANLHAEQRAYAYNQMQKGIAADVTAAQLQEAQRNREFQERMSSTAVQRASADLRAAGLNRILALGQPASSPSGSVGQVAMPKQELARVYQASAAQAAPAVSKIQAALSSAVQIAQLRNQLRLGDAEARIKEAEALSAERHGPSSAGKLATTIERTGSTLLKTYEDSKFKSQVDKILDSAARAAERLIEQNIGGTNRTTAKDEPENMPRGTARTPSKHPAAAFSARDLEKLLRERMRNRNRFKIEDAFGASP